MKIFYPNRILTPTASKLLADRTYDIEFHGYLSNHAKHAIIALDRLDASEERVEEWWRDYTSMTPYNLQLHKVDQDWEKVKPASLQQWKEWRGRKENWQEQVSFVYKRLQEKHNGNTAALLAEMAPEVLLSPSLAGSLMHGIIHLGWGVDSASPWMISEGLAYLNFCAVGVDPIKIQFDQHDDTTPMDSLIRVSKVFHDENLKETWIQKAKDSFDKESFHPELVPAGFQWEVAKVLEDTHPIATEMPSWLTIMSVPELYESLYRTVTRLYLATRDENGNGNFLLLHLLTSLWGLEHVLRVVEKPEQASKKDSLTRKSIAQWYANLICFVAASGGGFPSAPSLKEFVDGDYSDTNTNNSDLDWSNIVELGIAEEEEHNIKLVYVTRELWHRYGYWYPFFEAANSFTVTPNIGPDTPEYDT